MSIIYEETIKKNYLAYKFTDLQGMTKNEIMLQNTPNRTFKGITPNLRALQIKGMDR